MAYAHPYRVALLTALTVLASVATIFFFRATDAFYIPSQGDLPGVPGSIIRSEPIEAFPGAKAWRVLYRSTGLNNESIAVSGIVVAPDEAPPAGGYPLVAWAHPTTGIARRCAPSLDSAVLNTIPDLRLMVAHGFAVAATDYAGLGTSGPHPYLVGLSAGRTVLDSVRAARALTKAGGTFAVWGHSQGGHAVLWSGELAPGYAPDLKLVGVAAAAPAIELAKLFKDDHSTPAGEIFTALALLSWSKVYNVGLDTIIGAGDRLYVNWIGEQCLTNRLDLFIDSLAIRFMNKQFLRSDPVKTEPWNEFIVRNSPVRRPPNAPLLLAQGSGDLLITPAITRDFCGQCLPERRHRSNPRNEGRPPFHRSSRRQFGDRMDGRPVCRQAGTNDMC
jgi:acetyl esterase/lipase